MDKYVEAVIRQLWCYGERRFRDQPKVFLDGSPNSKTPPVFRPEYENLNVTAPEGHHKAVVATLALTDRQKWFSSMRSSQALAQSVFGTLKVMDRLDLLANVRADDGTHAFFSTAPLSTGCHLEYPCRILGEQPGKETKSDVFFEGLPNVSVECKFTESSFTVCSQTQIKVTDRNYQRDFCDGSYRHQRGRNERCSLTTKNILYWSKLPAAFSWSAVMDHNPCPILRPYQLVRNVLAAEDGHALLVYDERNPEFADGGGCWLIWQELRGHLLDHSKLRRCSWQRILAALEAAPELTGFVGELKEKYGI